MHAAPHLLDAFKSGLAAVEPRRTLVCRRANLRHVGAVHRERDGRIRSNRAIPPDTDVEIEVMFVELDLLQDGEGAGGNAESGATRDRSDGGLGFEVDLLQ